jgi:hypothetical protein
MAFDPNDPADKKILADAIAEATGKLESKRDELIAELRAARKKGEIDPKDYDRLESELDEVKGQLSDAQKAVKDAAKRAETAEKALTSEQAATQRLLIDNGLTAALTEAGVTNPIMLKAATALLRGEKIEIAVDGETRVAKIGDKLLGDHVKAWAAGDEGKAFASAPNNGGGGAGGSGGGGGKVNPWAKDTFNMTEQGKLYNENPTLAKSLAAEHGVTL